MNENLTCLVHDAFNILIFRNIKYELFDRVYSQLFRSSLNFQQNIITNINGKSENIYFRNGEYWHEGTILIYIYSN